MMLKRKIKIIIKDMLVKVYGRGINELEKIDITNYDVISFDIFDTLIVRKCGIPSNVFDIVADDYLKATGKDISITYKANRIKAESVARAQSSNDEIQFEDIFDCIESYNKTDKSLLMRYELENEYKTIAANAEMVKFFNDIKNYGKKIVVTSDMYLSEVVITEFLNQCGIVGYDKLYLSSKYIASKKRGSLFEVILKDNCNCKILHIGDHPKSDYLIPTRYGIDSFLYRKMKK